MTNLNPNGTLHIEEYSFHEFLLQFQEAVLNGFYLDLDTNDHFPQKFGDYLSVVLVPGQYVIDEEGNYSGAISRNELSASQLQAAYDAVPVVIEDEVVEATIEAEVATEVKRAGRPKKT